MNAPAFAWDRLADLMEYPGAEYEARVDACLAAIDPLDAATPLRRFRDAVATRGRSAIQERYVDAFDFDPACTLNMTWHLVGDAPERGTLLSMLREDLSRAGVSEHGELPDHLAGLLRLMGRGEARTASELATLIAPAIAHVHEALKARDNPYADVLEAVGCVVAASRVNEGRP